MWKEKLKAGVIGILCVLIWPIIGFGQSLKRQSPKNFVLISGRYQSRQNTDTIYFTIWDNVVSYSKRFYVANKIMKTVLKGESFHIRLDSVKPGTYLSIGRGKGNGLPNNFLDMIVCEPGDDISILIENTSSKDKVITTKWGAVECNDCVDFQFSGKGISKIKCIWEIKKLEQSMAKVKYDSKLPSTATLIEKFNEQLSNHLLWQNKRLEILNRYKKSLNPDIFNQIKADLIGKSGESFFNAFQLEYKYASKAMSLLDKNEFSLKYSEAIKVFDTLMKVPIKFQIKSALFSELIIYKMNLESLMNPKLSSYDRIKYFYNGMLKEKIITNYLINYNSIRKADSLILDALQIVKQQPYKKKLETLLKSQSKGKSVYNFELSNRYGNMIKLSDFRGKIVFLDFWFTGCGGCAFYFKHIVSKLEEHYKDNPNIVFLTVSIDTDKSIWIKGLNSGIYTSHNIINLFTGDSGISHPIIKQLNVNSYPHPLLIDRKGQIFSNDESLLRTSGLGKAIETINSALSN